MVKRPVVVGLMVCKETIVATNSDHMILSMVNGSHITQSHCFPKETCHEP